MVLVQLQCPSVLRFATQFVILLAVPPHSSRQLLCLSPHFVHFFLVTLHFVSLHFATLRHPFTSARFSTPAANICARRRCHRLRYGALLAQNLRLYPACPEPLRRVCHIKPLHCVSITPDGRFTVHPSRWRSQAIPFVPLSIAFDGSLLATVPTSLRHSYASLKELYIKELKSI